MISAIVKTLIGKNYVVYYRPFELNIIGIRSAKAAANKFDDRIVIFCKQEDGEWIYHVFKATTDPGTYWLTNPLNTEGTAILKTGQYIGSHQLGLHRQKYKALIQKLPVTVMRDNNKDGRADYNCTKEETGLFGINIHRASVKGTVNYIDKYSAGCQVLADAGDFNRLIQLAERHSKLYGNNFSYTLITENDFAWADQ